MSQPSKRNKTLSLILKLAIAAAAMAWVFTKIDLQELSKVVSQAHVEYLLLATVFFILSKAIASLRLNVFFRNHEIIISEKENLKLYWLGMFYNIFLPGGVSGDGYKIYLLKKQLNKNLKELFTAVFVDRISGVAALTSFAAILLSQTPLTIPYIHLSWVLVAPLLGGFALFFYLFFKRYLKIYFPVVGYSFLVQGFQVIEVYFIMKGFGVDTHILSYTFVFLISSLVAIIPISVGGAGTRELAFMYGAQYLTLSPEISVSISLAFYLITLLVSLTGIYYSIHPPTWRAKLKST